MKAFIILSALLLSYFSHANSVDDYLLVNITESEVLADFWAGDDGEECAEPQVSILQRANQSLTVKVTPTGSAIGCYEVEFICVLKYALVGNSLEFLALDITKDCELQ